MNNVWTSIENKYLIENYDLLPKRIIAEKLNRTIKAVAKRAERLNLTGDERHKWTPEEIEILKNNFDLDIKDLASLLPRHTPDSILGKGYKLRLFRHKNKLRRLTPSNYIPKSKNTHAPYRKVMIEKIGRELNEGESVHHINCIHEDNRPENLHLCPTRSDHNRAHASINRLIKPLLDNGFIIFDESKGIYKLGPNSPKEIADDPNQKLFWFARKITW